MMSFGGSGWGKDFEITNSGDWYSHLTKYEPASWGVYCDIGIMYIEGLP
jgi:hypothetical protein